MSHIGITLIVLVALLAGCAGTSWSPSASAGATPQTHCERYGGIWRAQHGFCEDRSSP